MNELNMTGSECSVSGRREQYHVDSYPQQIPIRRSEAAKSKKFRAQTRCQGATCYADQSFATRAQPPSKNPFDPSGPPKAPKHQHPEAAPDHKPGTTSATTGPPPASKNASEPAGPPGAPVQQPTSSSPAHKPGSTGDAGQSSATRPPPTSKEPRQVHRPAKGVRTPTSGSRAGPQAWSSQPTSEEPRYHLGCAGVSPGIEHRPWHCEKCTPPAPPPTGTNLDKDKRSKKLAKDAAGSINPENSRKKNDRAVDHGKVGASLITGTSSAVDKTPKKHPDISKRNETEKGSVRSSTHSSRASIQVSLKRLEEKRQLEVQKLENQRRELEQERERLRKEKELEEQENAIARKQLQDLEQYLEEKHELEEQLADDEMFPGTRREPKSR
nr:arginine-glutamic acid dipeptide repeats protein-like [Aedes albopictus]